MTKVYRSGAIGALMDEYERAASDLNRVLQQTPDKEFRQVVDSQTTDSDCRSIQTITRHVIGAGYRYANYIRNLFNIPQSQIEDKLLSRQESLAGLQAMLDYTVETLEGRWEMTDEEITGFVIDSRWGVRYDLEQMLEHAIVHILRHRRQVERFLQKQNVSYSTSA